MGWRRRFRGYLERIAERYPPRIDVDLDDLADSISTIADGGIILSRVTQDPAEARPAESLNAPKRS